MARIALLSIGMRGHLAPLARLGRVLERQGHELHAWAPEWLADLFPSATRVHAHEPVPVRGAAFDLGQLALRLAEATERCTGPLVQELHELDVELVVHDVHVPWARVAADHLGLPRLVTTPLFPPPEPTGPAAEDDSGVGGPAADAVARRWGVELGGWRQVVWSPGETVLNFSTETITGRAERAPSWTYVGPLLAPPPPRPPRGPQPRVYVSFGTYFQIDSAAPRLAATALGGGSLEVLISTGRTAVAPDDLGPATAGIQVREFVEGRAALAWADVFVTHGGCSSVHEALLAGVPMVCLPHGADQFDWSRRVAELGAGRVAGFDAEAIAGAVAEVLADPAYADRARAVGAGLAAYDGPARVARVVAEAMA